MLDVRWGFGDGSGTTTYLLTTTVVGRGTTTHMKKAVMLFKGSKGAQFLFTAKYQNN
jgi:hypothetical protein